MPKFAIQTFHINHETTNVNVYIIVGVSVISLCVIETVFRY